LLDHQLVKLSAKPASRSTSEFGLNADEGEITRAQNLKACVINFAEEFIRHGFAGYNR
jgi:hypothetical protein